MKLVTHDEKFHTDDVFATALLLELFPDAEVTRTRDEGLIAGADIVYDVGRIYDPAKGRFDHHQLEAGQRENGIVYSAFGLLWQEYGEGYCDDDAELARLIDQVLVAPIDTRDNGQDIFHSVYEGVHPFTIDDIIHNFNPVDRMNLAQYDEQFDIAVEFARQVLTRVKLQFTQQLIGERELIARYGRAEDRRVLFLDERISITQRILDECPELLYCVAPRATGGWGILAIPVSAGSFENRQPLPLEWRGLSGDELVTVTGVADATFCHKNGFTAAAKTREGAESLVRLALSTS